MKKNPRVSIIVLNFNGIEDTRVCLNSLLKTRYSNFEVLLVDNGSTINEAEILQKEYPDERIRFIRFKKNVGFTGGNNRALKKTSGKYVVLLNNDIFVRKDWLGHLVSALENDKKTAVAQPKILWAKDKRKFDYSGASGGFIDTFGYPFTRGRIFDTLEEDRGQYDNTREIFWASGAAFMFRKSILSKTNQLFDNQFFNYMEEVDLCWQLWSLGYRIVVVPNSVIYHKVAATTKKNLIKKRFYEHRNNLLLLVKNLPEKDLIKITLIRAFLEISTYFLYFFSGKFKFFLALFLAHLDFLRLLPSFLRKRRRRNTFPPHFEGSIALEYFIKKGGNFGNWVGRRWEAKELRWNFLTFILLSTNIRPYTNFVKNL